MSMQGFLACPGKVQINYYKLIPISFLSFLYCETGNLYDIINYQLVFLNSVETRDNILIYLIILWGFLRINEHVHRNSDCLNTVFTCTLSVLQDSCIFYGV